MGFKKYLLIIIVAVSIFFIYDLYNLNSVDVNIKKVDSVDINTIEYGSPQYYNLSNEDRKRIESQINKIDLSKTRVSIRSEVRK